MKVLYRYGYENYGSVEAPLFGGKSEVSARLICNEYCVVKETLFGFWVVSPWGKKRWMRKTATKRFAWETKKEALNSFLIKKRLHLSRSLGRIEGLKAAIDKAERLLRQVESGEITL